MQNIDTKTHDLHGFVDSDWAGDNKHRQSVSGIAVLLGGTVVAYKSKLQRTIATSSTEAEFSAACDAGKIILYLRTILEELEIDQNKATILYEDNQGVLMMTRAKQPTRRTRHVKTSQFAILDWIEHDLLALKFVSSTDNASDAMAKALPRILHYKHFDRLMGRIVPEVFRNNKKLGIKTISKRERIIQRKRNS